MWIALVEGCINPERWPALLANKLKGRPADVVWLGAGEALTRAGGLALMKQLLDNLYYGDQTSAVSTPVLGVLEFRRPTTMSLREYTTEMRTRFQQLDARGEEIPVQTRGHILLNNAQLTSEQKGLVMATTQRDMTFNAIADAVCLLFTELKPALRLSPGHS